LRENMWRVNETTVSTLFPILSGENISDVVIENLLLDGNRERNANLDGNYAGCIFLQDCERVSIRGVTAKNYNGDGISWQICHDVLVENCVSENHTGLGLHPGSGSQRPVMRNNRLIGNSIGLFFCWGVRHGLADLRFIPKFLIAAGAFVVAYVFFSAVVRDPLPVIDEVVLGIAAAVASFILLGRRDLASRRAAKKRLDLRLVVDRISFRESEFVKRVEEALHSAEGEGVVEVVRRIVEPLEQGSEPGDGDQAEAAQFVGLLERRFNFRKLEREEPGLRRLAARREAARLLAVRKVDFPLYAVYKRFKRTVTGRR